MPNDRLVFSTNTDENRRCPRCREIEAECRCNAAGPVSLDFTAVIRIEKAHRGGKIVTVIDKLPAREAFLKDLSSRLKSGCGSGGSYRVEAGVGCVEIQGDKRQRVQELLAQVGIRFKGEVV